MEPIKPPKELELICILPDKEPFYSIELEGINGSDILLFQSHADVVKTSFGDYRKTSDIAKELDENDDYIKKTGNKNLIGKIGMITSYRLIEKSIFIIFESD
jgi:hypothetical protein